MRYRTIAPLLAFFASCGPDAEPLECHGAADFSVLISAPDGPLPPELVVKLYYGGRAPDDPEVLTLAAPTTPLALFCYVSDKNRVYDHSAALGSKSSALARSSGGAGGEFTEGGAGGGGDAAIEALVCNLYADGPARLEVVTTSYDLARLELTPKKSVCTVEDSIVLEAGDASM